MQVDPTAARLMYFLMPLWLLADVADFEELFRGLRYARRKRLALQKAP